MKVLGIGETIIDNVFRVDNLDKPLLEKKIPEKHLGGPIPAALIILARLGVDCTLVTSVGRDDNAKIIRKTLKKENVKLLHKLQRKTKVNVIIVERSSGARKKVRGSTIHPDIKNLDRKFIRQFDLIIIDRHEKTAFYEILLKKRSNTKIIIDPSTEISTYTLDMIKKADYPIIPIESLAKVGAKDLYGSLEKLFRIANKQIIVTAGDKGSVIYSNNNLDLIPAFQITAIDVTGAGDVYRGAFAYGIINNWEIKKCATFANFVAALQCTKLGNIAAIPTSAEMQIFDLINSRSKVSIPVIDNVFKSFMSI